MRGLRTDEQRRAMFANMMNNRYRPISRFAETAQETVPPVQEPKKEAPVQEPKKEEPVVYDAKNSFGNLKVDSKPFTVNVGSDDIKESPVNEAKYEEKSFVDRGNVKDADVVVDAPVITPLIESGSGSSATLNLPPAAETLQIGGETGVRGVNLPALATDRPEEIKLKQEGYWGAIGRDIRKGMSEGWKEVKASGREKAVQLGRDIVTGRVITKPVGEAARKSWGLGKSVAAGGLMLAAPAAAAFGATAGAGVTDAIRETGNLITDPKREFYMPPGYQRVWTGEGDKYKMVQVNTPQLQPVNYNLEAGLAMPPGVIADKMDIAEAASGGKSRPLLRGIEDADKVGIMNMSLMEAARAFEMRRPSAEDMSPQMRAAHMRSKDAAGEFMKRSGTGRAQAVSEPTLGAPADSRLGRKSQKQMEVEAIMNMPIMDAADAYEKGAKVVITQAPRAAAYGQVRRSPGAGYQYRPVQATMPVRPASASANIPGAGGAFNRYVGESRRADAARASGDIRAADRADAALQSRIASLERSPTMESKAALAALRSRG